MIVLVVGMQRSGSTFSYNIAREVLCGRGTVHHEAGDDLRAAMRRADGTDHVIVKTHANDPFAVSLLQLGGARAICTVRPIRDALASWIETFGRDDDTIVAGMRDWLALYRALRPHALIIPFDKIDRHPLWAAWRIGRYIADGIWPTETARIGLRYTKKRIKPLTDALRRDAPGVVDAGFTWYDSTTLLHRRHVSTLASRRSEQADRAERIARLMAILAPDIADAGLSA